MRHAVGLTVALLGLASTSAPGQSATSTLSTARAPATSLPAIAVLEDSTARLEVIGLKRWTVAMIQDSLAVYDPNVPLLSHSCAAILRGKLHFADAAVTFVRWPDDPRRKPTWYVDVIEPQDSALVRYRPAFSDTLLMRTEWAPIRAVFDGEPRVFERLVSRPSFMYADSVLSTANLGLTDSQLVEVLSMRSALRQLRSKEAVSVALSTLERDGRVENRTAAVVVLSQAAAAGQAEAWRALVGVFRDPAPEAWTTADLVLSGLLKRGGAPAIDWTPAVSDLRALLDGTNLYGYDRVLRVLTATRVSPTLAAPLLRGGGQLSLGKLGSSNAYVSSAARAFLVQIAGRDLGDDPRAWQRWLNAL